MPLTLGIDVGGTQTKLGLVQLRSGRLLSLMRFDTPASKRALLSRTAAEAAVMLGVQKTVGVGMGFPAPIDSAGKVLAAPHLKGFTGVAVEKEFSRELQKRGVKAPRVKAANDAKAAALGEFHYGGWGKDAQNLLVLTLGTGIGCGVFERGKLVRGASGFAGEAGHMLLYPKKGGAWEEHASASAVSQLALEAGLGSIDARKVAELEAKGNPKAVAIRNYVARHLAWGIQVLCHSFNPSLVVLGGRMSGWRGLVLRTRIEHSRLHGILPPMRIEATRLQNAGVLGAAALFRQK